MNKKDIVFRNGTPTNPEYWNRFKQLPKELVFTNELVISVDMIEDAFNPAIDAFTGTICSSSIDIFKMFCEQHNIECKRDLFNPQFFIRLKQ